VTPQLEVTLLPGRLIMDPVAETKRVGMSIINHTEAAFEGKITLTATPGITVSPAETDTKIESLGLEAYVFGVTAGKDLQPGHYAVNIDIGGKTKDWVAVDVPAVARKLKIQVDGKLDDWSGVSPYALAKPGAGADGKSSWEYVGKLWLAYDESGLHAAVMVDDAKHVQNREPGDLWQEDSVQIALDPLMNGARTQSGGYRDDDYEYSFAQANSGPLVFRSKGTTWKPIGLTKALPFAFKSESGKSVYEVSIPWTEVAVPSEGKAGADHRGARSQDRQEARGVSACEPERRIGAHLRGLGRRHCREQGSQAVHTGDPWRVAGCAAMACRLGPRSRTGRQMRESEQEQNDALSLNLYILFLFRSTLDSFDDGRRGLAQSLPTEGQEREHSEDGRPDGPGGWTELRAALD
jgi:hypothetical protein